MIITETSSAIIVFDDENDGEEKTISRHEFRRLLADAGPEATVRVAGWISRNAEMQFRHALDVAWDDEKFWGWVETWDTVCLAVREALEADPLAAQFDFTVPADMARDGVEKILKIDRSDLRLEWDAPL